MKSATAKTVLTDSQFWVPVAVLALGIALLAYLH
ncbi:MAG: translocated intimin receptor Tir [Terriglobia bacterium]